MARRVFGNALLVGVCVVTSASHAQQDTTAGRPEGVEWDTTRKDATRRDQQPPRRDPIGDLNADALRAGTFTGDDKSDKLTESMSVLVEGNKIAKIAKSIPAPAMSLGRRTRIGDFTSHG